MSAPKYLRGATVMIVTSTHGFQGKLGRVNDRQWADRSADLPAKYLIKLDSVKTQLWFWEHELLEPEEGRLALALKGIPT